MLLSYNSTQHPIVLAPFDIMMSKPLTTIATKREKVPVLQTRASVDRACHSVPTTLPHPFVVSLLI